MEDAKNIGRYFNLFLCKSGMDLFQGGQHTGCPLYDPVYGLQPVASPCLPQNGDDQAGFLSDCRFCCVFVPDRYFVPENGCDQGGGQAESPGKMERIPFAGSAYYGVPSA